tara:strand:+ start:89 stop:2044 length:1956 start_codon:yes stop_codon:yes gene_type:complete
MIKTIALFIAFVSTTAVMSQNNPVVLTINDSDITKSEFLQIYLKNNNDPKYDKATLDEYMILFTKFKLKVAEAEALGYDTIPKLMNELAGYRKQLALPYLIDSLQNKSLIEEAYFRTKNEVRASHILIKLTQNAPAADTLKAYNRLMTLKKRIENGEDFAMVASGKGGSEDPSVSSNGGDLGFFNAFQMVYSFEEAAYTTKVGEVSNPFRTRFGYHIVKVTENRSARGTVESSHIMVAAAKNLGPEGTKEVELKINEIYSLLKKGENFEALVAKYSDDPSSNKKGGVLPTFGTGTTTRMVPEFEDAAFSLKNDGDFSAPIKTNYGYHIVKRVHWEDVPPFESMQKGLGSKVAKDERSKTTQNSFVEKVKKEYKYKNESKAGLKWFYENLDSTFFKGKFNPNSLTKNKGLFTMDKQEFTQQQFAHYISSQYRTYAIETLPSAINKLYQDWEKNTILNYEESKLAGKYPAYKALITEYHDGILLYEIMSDKVWNKAMIDTVGLKNYFLANEGNYMWGKRIDSDIYECYTKEDASKTYNLLLNDTITVKEVTRIVNGESELKIRYRTGKFDLDKTSYLKDKTISKDLNKPFEVDGKFYVLKVNDILSPSQKVFSESKGAVTSDYQNHLEEEWLKELSKKHSIKINSEELYSIGQ